MITITTASPDQTQAVASALAPLMAEGDLVVLCGDLGAGKTTFTQGLGRALGVIEQITSPTFTLVHQYEGRLTLNHVDVYRIERLDEVIDLALPELLDGRGLTIIEWGDSITPALPKDYLEVRLLLTDDDDERRLELVPVGSRWMVRRRALHDALTEWSGDAC